MLEAGFPRGAGKICRFGKLLLRRHVLPEQRDAISAISPVECAQHAFLDMKIRLNDFGAEVGEGSRFFGFGVAGDCAGGELAVPVAQYRTDESAALLSSCAGDGDDLLVWHRCSAPLYGSSTDISQKAGR